MGTLPTARNEMMINTARCIMREERRITVRELATLLDISIDNARSLLRDNLQTTRVLPMDSPSSNV